MVETLGIISSIAGILGISLKDFLPLVKAQIKNFNEEKAMIWRKEKDIYANQEKINRALVSYYGQSGHLKPYSFSVDEKIYTTYLYTNNNLTQINSRVDEIKMSVVENDTINNFSWLEKYSSIVTGRLKKFGVLENLHNSPIFTLSSLNENPISINFSTANFLDYRFTIGLVEDELHDALISVKGNVNKLIEEKDVLLPIRNRLIPSISSFFDFESRFCQTGIVNAFVMSRKSEKDFLVTYQLRSSKVGDMNNTISLIPRAFHSYHVDKYKEVNMYWTVFREIYEELFGGEEAEKDVKYASHDWYFERDERLKWFLEHDSCRLDALTFGANALQGGYSLSTCLCILDSWYFEKYGKTLKKSWESSDIHSFSTKNTAFIRDIFENERLLGDAKAHFVDILLRLKEIDPQRVSFPEIERL